MTKHENGSGYPRHGLSGPPDPARRADAPPLLLSHRRPLRRPRAAAHAGGDGGRAARAAGHERFAPHSRQRHESARDGRAARPHRRRHGAPAAGGARRGRPLRPRGRAALAPGRTLGGLGTRGAGIRPRHPRHARRRGGDERGRLRRRDEGRRGEHDVHGRAGRARQPLRRRARFRLPAQRLLRGGQNRARLPHPTCAGRPGGDPRKDGGAHGAPQGEPAAG